MDDDRKHWPKRDPAAPADYQPYILKSCEPNFPFLYFAGTEDGKIIKSGYSGDRTFGRIKKHIQDQWAGCVLLAMVRGTKTDETAVHDYFIKLRRKSNQKEVFLAGEELISYIVWLRDHRFVSITEEEFFSPKGQMVVDSTFWLPKPDRISSRRSDENLFSQMDPWSILPSRVITGDDWYTHPTIITAVRDALGGGIDLDPASHIDANETVRATRYFTRDQNGLHQSWEAARIYLNPPFDDYEEFVDKVREEYAAGHFETLICLAASRGQSNLYMRRLFDIANGLCIITGRYPFWGIKSGTVPVDGWYLVHIGREFEQFARATACLGCVAMFRRQESTILRFETAS